LHRRSRASALASSAPAADPRGDGIRCRHSVIQDIVVANSVTGTIAFIQRRAAG
jgi:hypothetical protein